MKTLYTLLIACGLCFTVHAQQLINFDQLNQNEVIQLEQYKSNDTYLLLLQEGFAPKLIGDSSKTKVVHVVGFNTLNDEVVAENIEFFSQAKAILINDFEEQNVSISPLDLSICVELEYITFNMQQEISNTILQNWISNSQLPLQIKIVKKVMQLN